MSISDLARQHGISRQTLAKWRDDGLDITNSKAIAAKVAAMETRTTSPNLQQARLEKVRAETRRIEFAHSVEQGRFTDSAAVQSTGYTIGLLIRQAMQKLEVDLPPQLAGHDAAKIHSILKRVFREVLQDVSERSASSPIQLIDQ